MKNIISFSEEFIPILLINEEATEAPLNTIYLEFQTGPADNPRLEIYVGPTRYVETLEKNTEYEWLLPGNYWANGAATNIRLIDDDGQSIQTTITFPALLSTDAALLQEDETHFYLQGQKLVETELKTQVVVYTNTREYDITSNDILTRIIQIVFSSSLRNAQAIFNATINIIVSDVTDSAVVSLRISANRVMNEVFIPAQTVTNGRYILTISYPVVEIAQNDQNQIDIYLETTDGTITIEQGQILASVTASGISKGEGFNGQLEIMQTVPVIEIIPIDLEIKEIDDSAVITVDQSGAVKQYTEELSAVSLGLNTISIKSVEDIVAIGRVVLYLTISPARANEYIYNRGYVSIVNDEFSLNETYNFISERETIDSGSLKSCTVDLSNLTPSALVVTATGETQATYKTLISDGTNVYSIENGSLTASVGLLANINAALFQAEGFADLTDCATAQADIFALGSFEILRWCDDATETDSTMLATITATPTGQYITVPSFSITDANVTGIELTTTDSTGSPQVEIKFDSGSWEYYDFTDQEWEEVGTGTIGHMTVADLENITEQIWAEKFATASSMQTRLFIPTTSDTIGMIQYKFLQED